MKMNTESLEPVTNLKKVSVDLVINKLTKSNLSNERSKKDNGNTSPTIENILNSNTGSDNEKTLKPKTSIHPSTNIKPKSAGSILENSSSERSYILTHDGLGDSKQLHSFEHEKLPLSSIGNETHRRDSNNRNNLHENSIGILKYKHSRDSYPNKLMPLPIPQDPKVNLLSQAGNSKSFEHVPSYRFQNTEVAKVFSTTAPSSIPSIGCRNSNFFNVANSDESQLYHICNGQFSSPGEATERFYSKSLSISNGEVVSNSQPNTKYNSVDSNSADIEMGNRLLHQGRLQSYQENPPQFYSVPHRMNEYIQHQRSSLPIDPKNCNRNFQYNNNNNNINNNATNIRYDRQISPGCNSLPHPGMYHSLNIIPKIASPMCGEIASDVNGNPLCTSYEKFNVHNNESNLQNNPYSQSNIYMYNPVMSGSPPMNQYPPSQEYPFPVMEGQQCVAQYGKASYSFYSKKINQCNICGKILTRPSSLHSHMFVHTGDRPYVCKWPNCGKTFNVKSNMNRHYKLHLKRQVVDN